MANQASSKEAARQWILKSYNLYDTFNVSALSSLYTENAVLRFAGGEDIIGRDNILAFFTQAFPTFTSMSHNLIYHDISSNRIYQQSDITYTFPGGRVSKVHAMAVSVFEEDAGWEEGKGGRMVRFEVYLDGKGVFY